MFSSILPLSAKCLKDNNKGLIDGNGHCRVYRITDIQATWRSVFLDFTATDGTC